MQLCAAGFPFMSQSTGGFKERSVGCSCRPCALMSSKQLGLKLAI